MGRDPLPIYLIFISFALYFLVFGAIYLIKGPQATHEATCRFWGKVGQPGCEDVLSVWPGEGM